jgi:16S rRNA (uracil1498-N3)-methyltransferase
VPQAASVPPLLRQAAALVYVTDLESPELSADDAHHLSAVLRLRPGEVVAIADGAGRYRGCRVTAGSTGADPRVVASGAAAAAGRVDRRRGRPAPVVLEPDTDVAVVARVEPELTVGFSLAKGDRGDWAVAKLSELGVDRIVPLVCERTAVRWSQQAVDHQIERLRRIAREASMQSRRAWLPVVLDLLPLAEAAATLGDGIALAEPGGAPPSLARPTVLVGPEGGFSPRELAMGFPQVGLGDTILRIETAAVVAGAMLAGFRAGVLGHHPA